MTPNARLYSWTQLLRRAGILTAPVALNEDRTMVRSLDLVFRYGNPQDQLCSEQEADITIVPCSSDALHQLMVLPPDSLSSWRIDREASAEFGIGQKTLPVLLRGQGASDEQDVAISRHGRHITLRVDILAATYFMLTRWEEVINPVYDAHGRYPATASTAYRQGFLDRPIIDEYGCLLAEILQELRPQWTPKRSQFRIFLTHDIDWIRRFGTTRSALGRAGKQLIRQRDLYGSKASIQTILNDTLRPLNTPQVAGLNALAKCSEDVGMRSCFYFMAASPTTYDSGYNIKSNAVRQILVRLSGSGHKIGLHPSYYAFDDLKLLIEEKQRLEHALGDSIDFVRYHYLRFRAPYSWRMLESAGVSKDSTLGYADHEGFRAGTCIPFQPFDIEQDRVLNLLEYPLIAMDATLIAYRDMDPANAYDKLQKLAMRCSEMGGMFTLLWHNNRLEEAWWDVYVRLVSDLSLLFDGIE